MTPADHRRARGDAAAVVMVGSGAVVTYAELDDRSMQLAHRLRAHGLVDGDCVAVMLENHPRYFEVCWAALRSGLYVAPISWHLDRPETAALVEDSGAAAFVTSAALADIAVGLGARRMAGVTLRLAIDGDIAGYTSYERAIAAHPAEPFDDDRAGEIMFYSSGTTGRPKTIVPALSGAAFGERPNILAALFQARWGFGTDTVLLTAAPLYHAGPTGFSLAVQRLGGTVVVLEDFDAEGVLAAVEAHQVTHALLLPTHLQRLGELDEGTRSRYDRSSLRVAVHGAGPCPVEVKEQLIDWWGKIVHEYYVGSEGTAFTLVDPEEWLDHRGTVGRPLSGQVHILDTDGVEVPAGTAGEIWFEGAAHFEYHNDPEATAAAFDDRGWSTLGDVGYVDEDGFLYVVDRVADVIHRDGDVVHPQVVEHALVVHPAVTDAAVTEEAGSLCAAVVVAADHVAGAELADELLAHCTARLPAHACPCSIDFVDSLPRLPTGKLLKRYLGQR